MYYNVYYKAIIMDLQSNRLKTLNWKGNLEMDLRVEYGTTE